MALKGSISVKMLCLRHCFVLFFINVYLRQYLCWWVLLYLQSWALKLDNYVIQYIAEVLMSKLYFTIISPLVAHLVPRSPPTPTDPGSNPGPSVEKKRKITSNAISGVKAQLLFSSSFFGGGVSCCCRASRAFFGSEIVKKRRTGCCCWQLSFWHLLLNKSLYTNENRGTK